MNIREFAFVVVPGAVLVALALVASRLWTTPIPIDPISLEAKEPMPASVAALNFDFVGPQFSAAETLRRPLFSPSRRPTVPPIAIEAPPEPTPPVPKPASVSTSELRLVGVLLLPRRARALVQSPTHPTGRWLKVGAQIEGWRVHRIMAQEVLLHDGTRSEKLSLYVDKSKD